MNAIHARGVVDTRPTVDDSREEGVQVVGVLRLRPRGARGPRIRAIVGVRGAATPPQSSPRSTMCACGKWRRLVQGWPSGRRTFFTAK